MTAMDPLGRWPARACSFLRSPVAVLVFVWRRWRLRRQGVSFGPGLVLEGPVEVAAGRNIQLGKGVRLGRDVYLGCWPNGRITIGDNTYVGRGSIILGHCSVTIGGDCLIAPGCHITDVNHGIEAGKLIREQALESQPVRIGNDVWFGAGCSVVPGVTIGDGAVVGARAVVTRDIPPNAIAVGVPAEVIRYR